MAAANTLNTTLYSHPLDIYSHYCRLILAEKNVATNIVDVDSQILPEDLLHLSPYHTVPVLVDRDVVLYETRIIAEYIDERFPHPPLCAVYPAARAQTRLLCYRIMRDWFELADEIQQAHDAHQKNALVKKLTDGLTSVLAIFAEQEYFLSQQYSLADAAISVLLWRLPALGVVLPPQAQAILDYAQRMFARECFEVSLSEQERALSSLPAAESI